MKGNAGSPHFLCSSLALFVLVSLDNFLDISFFAHKRTEIGNSLASGSAAIQAAVRAGNINVAEAGSTEVRMGGVQGCGLEWEEGQHQHAQLDGFE